MDELTVVALDHLTYLTDDGYRRAVRVRMIAAGENAVLRPIHEADGSCCRRESWMRTMFGLGHALREDGYVFDVEDVSDLEAPAG